MQNTPPSPEKRERTLNKFSVARAELLCLIIISLLNIILLACGSDTMFLFSASIPYFGAFTGMMLLEIGASSSAVIFFLLAAFVLLAYLACWIFSKKHFGWMIAALVLFGLDTAYLLFISVMAADLFISVMAADPGSLLDLAIHGVILYYLITGVINGSKLKKLPENPPVFTPPQPAAEAAVPLQESTPLYPADTNVKFRVRLEGQFAGHHVVYRRVKRYNEFVIDGMVYDQVEMLMETQHQLKAVVNGHCFILTSTGVFAKLHIDGVEVAKKTIWI